MFVLFLVLTSEEISEFCELDVEFDVTGHAPIFNTCFYLNISNNGHKDTLSLLLL